MRIVVTGAPGTKWETLLATADDSGSFRVTAVMPEGARSLPAALPTQTARMRGTTYRATATGGLPSRTADTEVTEGRQESDGERLLEPEMHWATRQTYPTGEFDPEWVRRAAVQDAAVERRNPTGHNSRRAMTSSSSPLALSNTGFTALGPAARAHDRLLRLLRLHDDRGPHQHDRDRSDDDHATARIVAYAASVGGGVWKTTNCCSASTTWTVKTDDPLISTTSIDSLTLDPNNHNTIYAGTGDLNYGSFSMGSQGILKSTDAGATWTVLGADVFGAALPRARRAVSRNTRRSARCASIRTTATRSWPAPRPASTSRMTAAPTGPAPA